MTLRRISSGLHSAGRFWLTLLVLAWGVQAIVTQSLLVREALVLMYGSEFAWGVVLFAWLFGVAVGAGAGGWIAARLKRTDIALVVVLMTLSAAACAELWVFRGARSWLGVEAGELLPLPKTAIAAVLFISPVSALVGLAFPLACCVRVGRAGATGTDASSIGAQQLGNVYALESAGSLIGGAAFSFWAVERLAPIENALVCGVITAAASAGLLAATGRSRVGVVGLAVVAAGALLTAVAGGETLDRRLIERRWRNVASGYELCAEAESKYQNLAVGRRAGQFTLYCDGHVAADFPDPYTFTPLAHFWMCEHPSPKHVLVLGGGAEGLLAEILLHPIEHVDYVEPDPQQIELIRPFLAEADRRALDDPRVTVHHADARYFIKTQRDRFDLVIARLPEPTSALRARFYTAEFYAELRRSMTAASVLCMTVAAAPADLPTATAEYVASIRATLRQAFGQVTIGWGDTAQVLAATRAGLVTISPEELADRYTRRGVQSDLFDPLLFGANDWLDPDKLQARAGQLDAVADVEISTDLRPVVYLQRLGLWEQMTSGEAGRVIAWLRSVKLGGLISALAVVSVLVLIGHRLRGRAPSGWADGAVVLSVGTTGLATMALSIVWLFAFQHLYGYVYQRIGWIIAVFMGGLVIGCALVSRRARRAAEAGATPSYLWRRLVAVDVLIAVLAFVVPFILPALGRLQSTPLTLTLVEWAISILVAITGVLGGAAFALAAGLRSATAKDLATAAGSVDSADHAGACLGALLCGILLVPVFGTAAAAFLLAGVKLCSAGVLLAVSRRA